MQTVILIDGTPNPGCYLVKETEPTDNLRLSALRGAAKVFEFKGMIGNCRIYKLANLKIDTKEFDRLAAAEADKFNNPERYAGMSGGHTAAEKELAAYKAKFGPLKEAAA